MKNLFLLIFTLFFCACSIKLENRYFKNEIIQYNDEIKGITIKIKKQGSKCLKKAILETRDIYLLLDLDEKCNVLSGKYFNKYKKYIKDFPENQKRSLSLKIKKYLKQRESVNNQISETNL